MTSSTGPGPASPPAACTAPGMAGAIGFVGWLALDGRASLGDVALVVQVARMAIGQVQGAARQAAWLAELSFVGERYLWLLEYRPTVVAKPPEDAVPAPERIAAGIAFENVSFTYPGTDEPVLTDVSLFIPAGTTVALVGRERGGQDQPGQAALPLLRPHRRADHRRRHRPPRPRPRRVAGAHRRRLPGLRALPAGGQRGRGRGRPARHRRPGARRRLGPPGRRRPGHRAAARGPVDPARPVVRGRRRAVRGRVAAGGPGPGAHAPGPRPARARRAHGQPRPPGRARGLRHLRGHGAPPGAATARSPCSCRTGSRPCAWPT